MKLDPHSSNISIRLRVVDSEGRSPFQVNHAEIESGYFHTEKGYDHKVQIGTVNRKEFSDGDPTSINAVNRTELGSFSLYGTEGRFDVHRGGKQIIHVYWDIGPSNGVDDHNGFYSLSRPKVNISTGGVTLPPFWSMPENYEMETEGLDERSFNRGFDGHKVWSTEYNGTITFRIK